MYPAIAIASHTRAPVFHFESGNLRRPDLDGFFPTQFVDVLVAPGTKQIRSAKCRDNGRAGILDLTQAGQIEMVHVGVGKKDQIHMRQLPKRRRDFNNAFDPDCERTQSSIRPRVLKHGIG